MKRKDYDVEFKKNAASCFSQLERHSESFVNTLAFLMGCLENGSMNSAWKGLNIVKFL